jgi:hypothetical protein
MATGTVIFKRIVISVGLVLLAIVFVVLEHVAAALGMGLLCLPLDFMAIACLIAAVAQLFGYLPISFLGSWTKVKEEK